MKTLTLIIALATIPAQAGFGDTMQQAALLPSTNDPSFEGASTPKAAAAAPAQTVFTAKAGEKPATPTKLVYTAKAGEQPAKPIRVSDDDDGLEPVDADLIRANRQLRKESHYPLQWLKKNGQSNGRLTKAEQKCFEIQRAEFEKAMNYEGVDRILERKKIKRMTFSLRTNNSAPEAYFNMNVPRSKDAFGGNYMVVKFSVSGGRCRITTARSLLTGAIASITPPVRQQVAQQEEEETEEQQEEAAAPPAPVPPRQPAQARVEAQPPSAYRPPEQVTQMPTPAPAPARATAQPEPDVSQMNVPQLIEAASREPIAPVQFDADDDHDQNGEQQDSAILGNP